MSRRKNNLFILLMMMITWKVKAQTRDLFMDSPTACGKTFAAGDREVFRVKPRGTVGVSNPTTNCVVYFESSQASSNYKFEIVVEAASFRDCGLQLRIFDGKGTGGNYLRVLGCGSTTSTAQFYSKDRAMSLLLTRTQNQYFFGSDFQLKIQLYYDSEGADEYIGTYKFPAGAIIGIVLGVIVIIAAAILLGWCYKNGRLPGLNPYDYPAPTVKASTENLSRSDALDTAASKNGGFVAWHNTEGKNIDSRSNFDLDDSRIWESLTSVNTNNTKKDNIRPIGRNNFIGDKGVSSPYDNNRRDNNTKSFQRLDPNQLSNSPTTRIRGRNEIRPPDKNQNFDNNKDTYHTINDLERETNLTSGQRLLRGKGSFGADNDGDKKRNSSGVFVNPDKEGYMYDYEHVKKLAGDSENDSKPKTQDFASELQSAIKRVSLRRQKSENQTDSDGQGLSGKETQEESSEFSSSAALNKQTDGEMTGPDAHSSPKPKKKKRKSSKERKSPKSPRKSKKSSKENNEDDVSKSPDSKSNNVDV
ncbi:homeobox protein 4-like [Ruditapes philippinarum]|uniref:homeobox protein 4-like n=1 Tax=Ruditapes philippinarum TaxID=129788 RepID=UPI00295C34C1|nr:homeobox protein 4-like [Ruditapes philippinarum]